MSLYSGHVLVFERRTDKDAEREKEDVGGGGVARNMFSTVCVCVFGAFSVSHNEYMCLKAAWTWEYGGLAVSEE